MIRNLWQELKKFPIVLLFLAFLFCFSILDALWPKREFSELENRKLMQPPKLTLAGVLSKDDPWMAKYTEYTKDQFIFRDGWIDLKSRAEAMLLKTENNASGSAKTIISSRNFLPSASALKKISTLLSAWRSAIPAR